MLSILARPALLCQIFKGSLGVFVLVGASLGCSWQPSEVPAESTGPEPRAFLRFVDINVWSGLDYEGNLWMGEYEPAAVREKRYAILLRQLRELGPDVIGVHEANRLPEYSQRLAQDLGYDEIHHVGVGGVRAGPVGLPWNLREGDAILARRHLGLVSAGREQLSGGPVGAFFTFHLSDATQVVAGRLTVGGRPVFVFGTHWHSSLPDTPEFRKSVAAKVRQTLRSSPAEITEAELAMREGGAWRREESRRTLAFIRRTAGGHPFVLMGDFNATADSPEIHALGEAGLTDAFRAAHPDAPGFTWLPSRNLNQLKYYKKADAPGASLRTVLESLYDASSRRIDFVFFGRSVDPGREAMRAGSGAWTVRDARVVLDRVIEGQHASDHFGILADLELR